MVMACVPQQHLLDQPDHQEKRANTRGALGHRDSAYITERDGYSESGFILNRALGSQSGVVWELHKAPCPCDHETVCERKGATGMR